MEHRAKRTIESFSHSLICLTEGRPTNTHLSAFKEIKDFFEECENIIRQLSNLTRTFPDDPEEIRRHYVGYTAQDLSNYITCLEKEKRKIEDKVDLFLQNLTAHLYKAEKIHGNSIVIDV